MADKEKRGRYSEEEKSLIRNTFKDQDELLVLLRRFLLQDELTADELAYLKSCVGGAEMMAVLRKTINPTLDKSAAIGQVVDMFSVVDLRPTEKTHAVLQIKALKKMQKYLTQRFGALEGLAYVDEIVFDELLDETPDDEETYVNFIARNALINFLDIQGLTQLQFLAGSITSEQIMDRLKQNSNK